MAAASQQTSSAWPVRSYSRRRSAASTATRTSPLPAYPPTTASRSRTASGNIFDDAARLPFPEFIERVGATALPELLEAAAAYNAVMLDRPEFPRQTLFKQLEDLGAADQPSREDGLRSFGKLLREGRIVKTQRGQFGLPVESAALTEAKRLIS